MKNILFMIADDLGRDLGYMGNQAIETPHLDQLVEEGILFTHAFATTASCSASRSVMFTGLHNHQTGHYGHNHSWHHFQTFAHIATAPKLFREAGYLTAIVGKKHVGPQTVYPWEIEHIEGFQGNRDVKAMSLAAGEIFGDDSGRPFFLTVGFGDPHRDNTRKGFANKDYDGVSRKRFSSDAVEVPSYLPDIPEVRTELAEYYESVHRLDQGIGLILAELEKAGKADDTLVLFISDNGIPFINSKTTLYEAGIHLPMIMRAPGRKSGIRNPNMVSYIDILPLFLDWAGIDGGDSDREGRSLLPICEATEMQAGWSQIYGSHTFHEVTNYYPTRVLRTQKYKYHKNVAWKLDFPFSSDLYASLTWEGVKKSDSKRIGKRSIKDYVRRPHEELYDLEHDPDEVNNLARDPAYKETLEQMRRQLEAWQDATADPWLYKDGVALRGIRRYVAEGLKIPDRNDMEF